MVTLNISKREAGSSRKELEKSGKIPAVFYGRKEESTPISVSAAEFEKVFKEAGESSVIVLKDGSEEHEALIHDVQMEPVKWIPTHVDFYVIEKGKKVRVHVPVEFEGESPAEQKLGGVLVKVLHEVEIEALPKDLPHTLKLDISSLAELNSSLHAKDIVLPAGVELITLPEDAVVLVKEAKEEEIEAPVEAPDLSTIEVEEKGKKEEEVIPDDAGEKSE